MNEFGKVEYVSNLRMNSNALQLFASPGGEMLWAPRGELCIKTCAPAPLRPSGWFADSEARCPLLLLPRAAGGAGGRPGHDGAFPMNAAAVSNAVMKLSRQTKCADGSATCRGSTKTKTTGPQVGAAGGSITIDSVVRLMRGEARCNGGLCDERLCLPLEPRFEPMAFRHFRRHQRNFYYRFEVLPFGAEHCCCF